MILYYATVSIPEVGTLRGFFSSEVKAKAWRSQITSEYKLNARQHSHVEQLEVPANKAGLIDWLNQRYGSPEAWQQIGEIEADDGTQSTHSAVEAV